MKQLSLSIKSYGSIVETGNPNDHLFFTYENKYETNSPEQTPSEGICNGHVTWLLSCPWKRPVEG